MTSLSSSPVSRACASTRPQLHAWGLALWSRSLAGLVAAALCHAAIYGVYFLIERPFVARAYAPPAADRDAPQQA